MGMADANTGATTVDTPPPFWALRSRVYSAESSKSTIADHSHSILGVVSYPGLTGQNDRLASRVMEV